MRYTVFIKPAAEKYLTRLRDARLFGRLRETIDGLATNPRPSDSLKMRGGDGLYRVRVGDYRIVYQIKDAVLTVLVVEIGHRREIYRR